MASNEVLFERLAESMPNPVTWTVSAIVIVLGVIAQGIPYAGPIMAKELAKVKERIDKDNIERNLGHRKAIETLTEAESKAAIAAAESEKNSAEHRARAAAAIAPHIEAAAGSAQEQRLTEEKSKANLRVEAERAALNEREIWRGAAVNIDKAKTGAVHLEQESIAGERAAALTLRTAHLDKMTPLLQSLEAAAKKTTAATKNSEDATQASATSIEDLTRQTNTLIKARSQLQAALGEYDKSILGDELAGRKATEVQKAMLEVMRSEGALDSMIETSEIKDKAELRSALKQDIHQGNKALEEWGGALTKEKRAEFLKAIKSGVVDGLKGLDKTIEPILTAETNVLLKRVAQAVRPKEEKLRDVSESSGSGPCC